MNQREILTPLPLLDKKGALLRPGFARQMLYRYNRHRVKAGPFSLKEWDFFQMMLDGWILQMTIGHVSYMANFAATLFSPATGERHSFSRLRPLPLGSLSMPLRPDAPFGHAFGGKGWQMGFDVQPKARRLWLRAEKGVDIDITLNARPEDVNSSHSSEQQRTINAKKHFYLSPVRVDEKMVIATPFAKPGQFFLNCKENYYGVAGHARFGDVCVLPKHSDTALLDWGRGVWPFHQEWFWGNGAAHLPGGRFGFNIGWGFGNLRHATENMFFWNGKAHKLGRLQVRRDTQDYSRPWHFTDEDGLFDFTMVPFYDNDTQTRLLFVNNRCHQVFGLFSGRAVLPGGKAIVVKDMPAFCEHAVNNW